MNQMKEKSMSKILHIKDAYFKIPDKAKDDFGCAITLLGLHIQREKLNMDDMNKVYEDTDVSEFMQDGEQQCLLSCEIEK